MYYFRVPNWPKIYIFFRFRICSTFRPPCHMINFHKKELHVKLGEFTPCLYYIPSENFWKVQLVLSVEVTVIKLGNCPRGLLKVCSCFLKFFRTEENLQIKVFIKSLMFKCLIYIWSDQAKFSENLKFEIFMTVVCSLYDRKSWKMFSSALEIWLTKVWIWNTLKPAI